MPNETFFRLPPEKKERVMRASLPQLFATASVGSMGMTFGEA
jgi:hypothetical protein